MCDMHENLSQPAGMSRRHLLKAGAAAALVPWQFRVAAAAGLENPPNAISPAEALDRLMRGNERFAANEMDPRDFASGRAARALAQYPFATIFSCSDSRVAPELAFDQGPGQLFVMRVAGNVMNEDLLGTLEYGVKFLGIPLVMVLGHTNCGAVGAAIKVIEDKVELPGHLPGLVSSIKPAVEEAKARKSKDLLSASIAQNVRLQVGQIKQSPPVINKYYKDGRIDVVGAVYDLQTGMVNLL